MHYIFDNIIFYQSLCQNVFITVVPMLYDIHKIYLSIYLKCSVNLRTISIIYETFATIFGLLFACFVVTKYFKLIGAFPVVDLTSIIMLISFYNLSQKIEAAKHLNSIKKSVKIDNCPRLLSEVLCSLSEEQKNWVKENGFRDLLELDLEMLPGKFSYNML